MGIISRIGDYGTFRLYDKTAPELPPAATNASMIESFRDWERLTKPSGYLDDFSLYNLSTFVWSSMLKESNWP